MESVSPAAFAQSHLKKKHCTKDYHVHLQRSSKVKIPAKSVFLENHV